jgi:hypothetical protein
MKFAQEEWQSVVVVGHVKQRFFFWRRNIVQFVLGEFTHMCGGNSRGF